MADITKRLNPNEYIEFLNKNLTPHHFIENVTKIAQEHNFKEHCNTRTTMKPGKHYIINGTMIFLIIVPETVKKCVTIAVHIDSPVYKLNPNFLTKTEEGKEELIPLAIKSYGGMLRHPWYDRELILAGKIVNKKGEHKIITNKNLICLIPSLAPHLNNGTYTKEDFKYSEKIAFTCKNNLPALKEIMDDNLGHDLSLHPLQDAFHDEISGYIYSGRQDNLSCTFPALKSIIGQEADNDILKIVAFYDYEEIGSLDRSGAHSTSLYQILEKFDFDPNQSLIVSADAAHAFNPMYPNNYEPNHKSTLGDGVVVKHAPTYSTEINSVSLFNKVLLNNKITLLNFTKANCAGGGGTVGSMLSAQMNIPTVDIGVPLLAMHSCREVTSIKDITMLKEVFDAVFQME